MAHAVQSATAADAATPFKLTVVPKEPLDPANGRYRIQVEGFGPAVPLVPRGNPRRPRPVLRR